MGKYLKKAFANRWNLLALIGGAAFALLSGKPDVLLPIVAAAEIAYLGFVSTHPKFRTYVDLQEATARRQGSRETASQQQNLERIMRELPEESRERFRRLRARCIELRAIAQDIKQPGRAATSLESLQSEGLDKLLWVFLRLLFTKHTLQRFFQRTDEQRITEEIARMEQRLRGLEDRQDPHSAKMRSAVTDNLLTSRSRLDNYRKAEANYEYVELEIDRLENKIKSLSELAVNRQEPEYITSQVNEVAESMLQTEETINELDFVTHLGADEERPPELLRPTLYISD